MDGNKGFYVLSNNEWYDVIIGKKSAHDLAVRIRQNNFSVWCKPLLQYSSSGDSMLELGSGTGELSAILAIYGRIPYLLDYSGESIHFSESLFQELNKKGNFSCQNVSEGIPMKSNSVDWVWSSGLLEHFSDKQILDVIKESVRVCKKGVMSLVPNANSVFYRIGKSKMERDGTWSYGKEVPKFTMKNYFESAGLTNITEFSVATYHSINFLNSGKKAFRDFYDSMSLSEIQALNQGYLLFTCGEKPR